MWANDSQSLYYVKQDGSCRPFQLFKYSRYGYKRDRESARQKDTHRETIYREECIEKPLSSFLLDID